MHISHERRVSAAVGHHKPRNDCLVQKAVRISNVEVSVVEALKSCLYHAGDILEISSAGDTYGYG